MKTFLVLLFFVSIATAQKPLYLYKVERVGHDINPYVAEHEEKPDTGAWFIEPIAKIAGEKYTPMMTDGGDPEELSESHYILDLAQSIFAIGSKCPLYYDNEQIGTAKITKCDSENVGFVPTADVKIELREKGSIPKNVSVLLATNKTLRSYKTPRSVAISTADSLDVLEKARMYALTKKWDKKVVNQIKTTGMRMLDLDGDGAKEVIATITSKKEMKEKEYSWEKIYRMTLIFTKKESWQLQYSDVSSSKSESEVRFQDILDVIDLNGDGICEVVFRNSFYEAWNFSILKKVKDQWKKVYEGGGGGV